MNKRTFGSDGNPDEKAQALVHRITILAGELYKIMEPGLTIELIFPPPSNLVISHQGKAPSGKLLITKPRGSLHIQVSQ